MAAKTDQKRSKGLDEQIAHAMAHRVRVLALVILTERTASPKEISTELGLSLSVVSHHVKELLKLDWIELVREEPRRGAVEHYYRAIMRPELSAEQWELLSIEERERFSLWVIQLIMADATRAFDAHTFDARTERHLSRIPLYLDEEGWIAVAKIQNEAVDAIYDIQAESAGRMAETDEAEGIHASTAMYCIQMPVPKQKRRR